MICTTPDAGSASACKLCETKAVDPNFLLFVQFGSALSASKRQKIEQYINAVIYPRQQPSSRKRSRYDYDYDYSYDSEYSDYSNYNRRKRQRTANGYRQIAQSNGSSTLVVYDQNAGFTLDTTTDVLDTPLDYTHGVTSVLGASAGGLGNPCFNCSIPGHELRDCPWPLDNDRIEASRLEFKDKKGIGAFDSRLYLAVEEGRRLDGMRQRFRPGQMSERLREALGLGEDEVASFVVSMRYAGYPPAYLGSFEGQDPMEARPREVPPPTPALKVYDGIEDHSSELDQAAAIKLHDPDHNSATGGGEKDVITDDEEEGAISDDEEEGAIDDADDRTQPSVPQPPRNIPLVHYQGLDLSMLDFDHMGKPKPQRQSQMPDYYNHNNAGYQYGEDDWSGMLNSYYRQADIYNPQPLQYWQQPMPYGQPIAQPPPPPADLPPPPPPPVDPRDQPGISRLASEEHPLTGIPTRDRATQNQQSTTEQAPSDGELEDGECDMDTDD
ncbi:hypothetical protein DL89DRAFT_294084 [Linderina pennispora]|uniref:CCHC-type domain-containing protein n=1 Tax=Linderina pennispora TaxID=61395 RepID=A0A1Y1W497_9FUNG|nr:uncharacterized protein DL89DRAFT_294084 [Linderina pennispora]ORX68145.1 hypothetical protein DL89DRAFT_294084 [Linderina pennispora]